MPLAGFAIVEGSTMPIHIESLETRSMFSMADTGMADMTMDAMLPSSAMMPSSAGNAHVAGSRPTRGEIFARGFKSPSGIAISGNTLFILDSSDKTLKTLDLQSKQTATLETEDAPPTTLTRAADGTLYW